jgi:hypothetical protein
LIPFVTFVTLHFLMKMKKNNSKSCLFELLIIN